MAALKSWQSLPEQKGTLDITLHWWGESAGQPGSVASSCENQEGCWACLRPQAVNHSVNFFLRGGNPA